jgi:glycogen debranching enzyme
MADRLLLLQGSRFWLSDGRGDVNGDMEGLFDSDVRHISFWRLLVNEAPLHLLTSQNLSLSTARIFGTARANRMDHNPSFTVMREQRVEDAFSEKITIENHSAEEQTLQLSLLFDADFKDIFELREWMQGSLSETTVERGTDFLALNAQADGWTGSSRITFDPPPSSPTEANRADFDVRLRPRSRWTLSVVVSGHESVMDDRAPSSTSPLLPVAEFVAAAPRLDSDSELAVRTYRQSLVDLAALRFRPEPAKSWWVPGAGVPWFMALFGRDSLITAYQALPFAPGLARDTLLALARYQASEDDPYRDAEPGKILHELRRGKLAAMERVPHTPYYGSHDATPLFLILLDEYERWTGDSATVEELKSSALRALEWMESSGDGDGDGYLEYQTRSRDGLTNQCWKDSWDSIGDSRGVLAKYPVATCELQGYAYDARMRLARLCRDVWDDWELAARLETDAHSLKRRFNHDFWCPDREHFALALDGDKKRVDSLTSNIGHLLWSGIVEESRVPSTVSCLTDGKLFNGWGVRTMSTEDAPYNPIGYHTGTVWPHDSGIAAEGLRRYGYREEATVLAWSLFESAEYFAYRLPEVFGGFDRSDTRIPVEYPTASRPQAWAAGAPLLALRTILGLDRDGELRWDPCLPADVQRLELTGKSLSG